MLGDRLLRGKAPPHIIGLLCHVVDPAYHILLTHDGALCMPCLQLMIVTIMLIAVLLHDIRLTKHALDLFRVEVVLWITVNRVEILVELIGLHLGEC